MSGTGDRYISIKLDYDLYTLPNTLPVALSFLIGVNFNNGNHSIS
jgi:hypothetical protein